MTPINNVITFDFDNVPIDNLWNFPVENELKIHQIHAYPAKFPAFVTTKALEYARENNLEVKKIADVFCGCGTTAFEARRNNVDYFGCDINPVATMIAKTKSRKYQIARLKGYYDAIIAQYNPSSICDKFENANDRLKYWYSQPQYNALAYLKSLILDCTPQNSDYRLFFLCAFSNILKSASRWLTKSIKPQVDPNKTPQEPYLLFVSQCRKMFAALNELPDIGSSQIEIITGNFLNDSITMNNVDMIVTSPPYVTSYEYADLHQLSTLWLGFTEDYRTLRDGTIGSKHHQLGFQAEYDSLNQTAKLIYSELKTKDKSKSVAVAKYYLDMQKVAKKSYTMLNRDGIGLFVIGNTEYKHIKIDNVRHLAESLVEAGYSRLAVSKRKISKKILTPYRDATGHFTNSENGRKIYSEEFILIGRKQ